MSRLLLQFAFVLLSCIILQSKADESTIIKSHSKRFQISQGRSFLSVGRGGGGYYEHNPGYVKKKISNSKYSPMTLEDLDSDGYQTVGSLYNKYKSSPSIIFTSSSCTVIFLLWQYCRIFPHESKTILQLLQSYFVCSRGNLDSPQRWPGLLLSAMSHTGFIHLLFNLAALLSFGPQVQDMLKRSCGWPLWPLLLGAALSGSLAYVSLDSKGAGALGLSAVTLSLMAVYARFFPQRTLRMSVAGIFPIQMRAGQLLQISLLWSVIGSLALLLPDTLSTHVAHSAHLGGILFGVLYHYIWQRRTA